MLTDEDFDALIIMMKSPRRRHNPLRPSEAAQQDGASDIFSSLVFVNGFRKCKIDGNVLYDCMCYVIPVVSDTSQP